VIGRSGSGHRALTTKTRLVAFHSPLEWALANAICDAQGRRGDPERDFPNQWAAGGHFGAACASRLLPPASLVQASPPNVRLFEEAKERIGPRLALAQALTAPAAKGAEPRVVADEAEFRVAERASVGHSSPPPRTPDLRKIRSSRRRARTLLVGFAEGVRPNMRSLCPETRR
jgi:hypothetical protein